MVLVRLFFQSEEINHIQYLIYAVLEAKFEASWKETIRMTNLSAAVEAADTSTRASSQTVAAPTTRMESKFRWIGPETVVALWSTTFILQLRVVIA